jgi:hypothetical protein
MLIKLLRIPLTLVFLYTFFRMLARQDALWGGDIVLVMAYGLFGAIALAILWAPVIGGKISDPLTSTLTAETSLPPTPKLLVQTITRLQGRGHHRLALLLVFLEGIRYPNLPQPALLGLRSAKPGSFLERLFAKEVYKFNNIQNCLHAYRILTERHRTTPPLHSQAEVNLALMSLNHERPPEPEKLQLKSGVHPARPARNQRIRLFSP